MKKETFKHSWAILLLTILPLLIIANIVFAGDWPVFRHDANRSGRAIDEQFISIPTTIWSISLPQGVHYSSPSVSGDSVCIASIDGNIYVFNAKNGDLKWCRKTSGKIYSSPAIANGIVYVGSGDGNLYALDFSNGDTKWIYSTGSSINSSPVVFGSIVYFGCNNGKVYALNATTGDIIWVYSTGSSIWSSPAIAFNSVLYIGAYNGTVYGINISDGTLNWNYQTDGPIRATPAIIDGVVCFPSHDGRMYLIFIAYNNAVIKSDVLGKSITSSPAISLNPDLLYVGSSDGNLYALEYISGNIGGIKWQAQAGGQGYPIYSSPAVCKNLVFVGGTDGKVYAFDVLTGELKWLYDVGAPIESSIAISNSYIYFESEDGKLWAFQSPDVTPPVTTIAIGVPKYGETPTYITSATTITLIATDDISGVARTEYRLDTETLWNTYVLPFTIAGGNTHTIYYHSIDNAGNIEETKSITVLVDNSPPTTTISIGKPKYSAGQDIWITSSAPITLSATDIGSGGLPQIKNIVGFWQFEEASGTRYDQTANNFALTDNNTVLNSSGIITNGADFEMDNSQWLSHIDDNLFDFDTQMSFSFWVKFESQGVDVIFGRKIESWMVYLHDDPPHTSR